MFKCDFINFVQVLSLGQYLHIQDFCQIGLGTNVEFYTVSGAL